MLHTCIMKIMLVKRRDETKAGNTRAFKGQQSPFPTIIMLYTRRLTIHNKRKVFLIYKCAYISKPDQTDALYSYRNHTKTLVCKRRIFENCLKKNILFLIKFFYYYNFFNTNIFNIFNILIFFLNININF